MELDVEDADDEEDDGAPVFDNLLVFKLLQLLDGLWLLAELFPWLLLLPCWLWAEWLGVTVDIGFIFNADSNYFEEDPGCYCDKCN